MPIDRAAFITPDPLPNVAFDYFLNEDALIAKKVCQVIPLQKGTTKVSQVDMSKVLPPDDERGTNAEPALMDEQLFETQVDLKEYKEGSEINPRNVRDADVPSLLDEGRKVKILTQRLMLKQEIRAAALITTQANYATANTSAIASGSRWNEVGGSPETDLITVNNALMDGCGKRANALIVDQFTLDKMSLGAEWRARTQYTTPGPIPVALIAAFFKVDYIFVGGVRYNNALKGATVSMSKAWNDSAIFFYFDPKAESLESVSPFVMYMIDSAFWVDVMVDPKRKGAAGNMKRVTVGTEYVFAPGMVESAASAKFVSAYLLRTVVA